MARHFLIGPALFLAGTLLLSACSTDGAEGSGPTNRQEEGEDQRPSDQGSGGSIFNLFKGEDEEATISVNKYIWAASIEVLDFLPIQTVDPFTGVIVTGFGTPPNGGRAYRATILIDDPALDARSLNVALQTRNGAATASTVRAVEDAILSRARQMRIADNKF
jgi:hypothetical protein